MEVNILFSQSAFKHGITEIDIRKAFDTMRYEVEIDEAGYIDKHLLIGFDSNANLIEIIYDVIDDDTVLVFHAMKCRKTYMSLLGLGE